MEAKREAKELVDRFMNIQDSIGFNSHNLMYLKEAKQCALICIDEIIESESNYFPNEIHYWQEVKEEINKL